MICMLSAKFIMGGLEFWLNSGLSGIFIFWHKTGEGWHDLPLILLSKERSNMSNLKKSIQLAATTTIYTINNDLTPKHLILTVEKIEWRHNLPCILWNSLINWNLRYLRHLQDVNACFQAGHVLHVTDLFDSSMVVENLWSFNFKIF